MGADRRRCVTVAGRDQRRIRHRGIRAWVGSQRFPQLWKTLWKSGRSWLDSRKTFGFPAIFGGRKRDSADSAALQTQAQYLAQYPNISITVEGHADERGTREYTLALGERRANAA